MGQAGRAARGPGGREPSRVGYAALERPGCGERTLCAGCRWGRRHRSERGSDRKRLPGSPSVECGSGRGSAGGAGNGSGVECAPQEGVLGMAGGQALLG